MTKRTPSIIIQVAFLFLLITLVACSKSDKKSEMESASQQVSQLASQQASSKKGDQKKYSITYGRFVERFVENLEVDTMAYTICAQRIMRTCFKIDLITCVEKIQPFVVNCSKPVKESYAGKSNEIIESDSEQDFRLKSANLGAEIGQQIGACAGSYYEQDNLSFFDYTEECIDSLKSVGVFTPELDTYYRELMRKNSQANQ